MSKQLSGRCPCCQAPLPPPQDEFQITCAHCGAQFILKLPLDRRIEKIAFERVVFVVPLWSMVPLTVFATFFYGWPLWRFWLRDSGYLDNQLILWGIIVFIILLCAVYIFFFWRFSREMMNLAQSCNWSISRLRQLVKNQPTSIGRKMLRNVEKEVREINNHLDM